MNNNTGNNQFSPAFFNGKKVFITGHTGFKGSWLSRILLLCGAKIKGYALAPNTEPALFDLLGLQDNIESVTADIRDGETLEKEVLSFKPDIIFHLAAQPLVRLSYSEPLLTLQTNVIGTANLFEAARKTDSAKVIINITTDKCYENKETPVPYKEDDKLGGYDPYSASKAMSELLTSCYRNSFFNSQAYGAHGQSLSSCRAGNVIGGGDFALDRIIPDCARALSQDKDIILRNPSATRPWQHVLEPLFAYMLLAQKMWGNAQFGGGWNFGPNTQEGLTVECIVKQFIKTWGSGSYKTEPDGKLHEAHLLHLDITKAKTLLGWNPVYDFSKSVTLTALWYKAFYDGQDIKALTEKQIKDYMGKL